MRYETDNDYVVVAACMYMGVNMRSGGELGFWDDVMEARVAEPAEVSTLTRGREEVNEVGMLMRETVLLRLQFAVSERAVDQAAALVCGALSAVHGAALNALADLEQTEGVDCARSAMKRVFEETLSTYDAVCTSYKRRTWIRCTFNPVVRMHRKLFCS